jgi:terminase small subunit-like protein
MAKNSVPPHLSIVGSGATGIQPPRQLGQFGSALWSAIQAEYGISDRGGIELLAQVCEATDRLQDLSAAIAKDGPVVYTRTGAPRSHPSLKDEIALRAFITRTIERLGLNVEAIKPPYRPGSFASWVPDANK